MRILGVDPGKTGAACLLDDLTGEVIFHNFKFNKDNQFDWEPFFGFIIQNEPDLIIMERIHGRGGMNATSTFNWGICTGQIIQVIRSTKFPFRQITPKSWQKIIHEGLPSTLKPKEKSYLAYLNICPHKPIGNSPRHDIIDAFLIAQSEIQIQKWDFKEFIF